MAALVRLTGPQKGEQLELASSVLRLGRARSNNIPFDRTRERVVGNKHAELRYEEEHWVLYDLQSTHGTFVNGQRISRHQLTQGDIIGLSLNMGGPKLQFFEQTSPANPTPPATSQPAQASHTDTHNPPMPNSVSGPAQPPTTQSTRILQTEGAALHETRQLPSQLGATRHLPPQRPSGDDQVPTHDAGPQRPAQPQGSPFGPPSGSVYEPVPESANWMNPRPSEGSGEVSRRERDDPNPADWQVPDGTVEHELVDGYETQDFSNRDAGSEVPGTVEWQPEIPLPIAPDARHQAPSRGKVKNRKPGTLLEGSLPIMIRVKALLGKIRSKAKAPRVRKPTPIKKKRKQKQLPDPSSDAIETPIPGTVQETFDPKGKPYPRQFVLEDAIKEKPRPELIWMQRNRWLIRGILVIGFVALVYQDEVAVWLGGQTAQPVPMLSGRPLDAPPFDPPGSQNPQLVAQLRDLYNQSLAAPKLEPTDSNNVLRAIRPVLARSGEDPSFVPVDFLKMVQNQIKLMKKERLYDVLFRRSLKRRSQLVSILANANIPEIYSFIPWLESGFLATFHDSRSGRVGLWGLTQAVAQRHGLVVTSARDERLDPRLATSAAAEHITEIIGELRGQSFLLGVASYHEGTMAARRLMARQSRFRLDEFTLWNFHRKGYIPADMTHYLVQVLAVAVVSESPIEFQLPPSE